MDGQGKEKKIKTRNGKKKQREKGAIRQEEDHFGEHTAPQGR